MVFWYFSLRGKSNRWLNLLPVGADSKSGATWVSQSVSTSVARAGTGQFIPAVALLGISLARSLQQTAHFFLLLFWFCVAVGASLQHFRRETQTSCCCCCSSRKEGRREERKQPVAILQQQLQTDPAVFEKQENNNCPVFSCNAGALKQQQLL